jgi:hypothetical protein
MAEHLALYPFEHFDLIRRRWVRGRYRGEVHELAERHGAIRITGAPELRDRGDPARLAAGHVARGPGTRGRA